MWKIESEEIESGRVLLYRIRRDGIVLARTQALEAMRDDAGFRETLIGLLAGVPFEAFFWETPPVTPGTAGCPFELVAVDSPALATCRPDTASFSGRFAATGESVAVFRSLGGDAVLVAPAPMSEPAAYPHLAAFSRRAPDDQQHALWRAVGGVAAAGTSDCPFWLSTSGLGVPWLHVRIDERPKYYTHAPYREWTES